MAVKIHASEGEGENSSSQCKVDHGKIYNTKLYKQLTIGNNLQIEIRHTKTIDQVHNTMTQDLQPICTAIRFHRLILLHHESGLFHNY